MMLRGHRAGTWESDADLRREDTWRASFPYQKRQPNVGWRVLALTSGEGDSVSESKKAPADYAAMAKQAEENAAKSADPRMRKGWEKLAQGYWHLAERMKPR